jgi:hypothetical protein
MSLTFHPAKFTLSLFIFSIVLGAIAFGLTFLLPSSYFSPAIPFLFPFFFASTYLLFAILNKSDNLSFSKFVNRFMLATFAKLMLFVIVLLVYVFTNKPDAVPFIIAFFILYLAYTVFELVVFLKK